MNDYEILQRLCECRDIMNEAEEVYQHFKSFAERSTASISENTPIHNSENSKDRAFVNMIAAKAEYIESLNQYTDAYKKASAAIYRLDDPIEIHVMAGRYLFSKSWRQIAAEAGQTERNCHIRAKKAEARLMK